MCVWTVKAETPSTVLGTRHRTVRAPDVLVRIWSYNHKLKAACFLEMTRCGKDYQGNSGHWPHMNK